MKEIALVGVELSAANEERFQPRLVHPHQRQKTEKGTCSLRGAPACELCCDSLGHTENISRVLIVLSHERFASELPVLLGIVQAFGDLFLHVEMQNVGGAPGRVVQIRAHAQEKIVGRFDPPPVRFAQPIFPDEMCGGKGALLEIGHPKQILIIAQAAAPAFQLRLLQVNAVAEFFVAGDLIPHPHLDVFPLATGHAL